MQSESLAPRFEVGAFFVAFLGLFALATVPFLNLFVAPLVPIPLCAIFLRHGLSAGLLSVSLFLGLLVVFASAPEQMYYLLFASAAVILGSLGRRAVSAWRILATGAVGLTVLLAALFYGYNFYARWSGQVPTTDVFIDVFYNPEKMIEAMSRPPQTSAERALDGVFVWLTGEHLSVAATKAQSSAEFSDWLRKTEENRLYLRNLNRFPIGLFFVFSAVYFGMFYFASRWVLARWGIGLPDLEGFRVWRISWHWAWAPLVFLGGHTLCHARGLELGSFIFESLLTASLVPYAGMAVALAAYGVERFRLDPLMTALVYTLLLLNLKPLAVVAVFDSWFDFRRLDPKREPPAESPREGGWDDDLDL